VTHLKGQVILILCCVKGMLLANCN